MNISVDSNRSILSLFDKQVMKTPDATALITPDSTMSFRELQQKSEYIAQALQKIDSSEKTAKNKVIGLCIPRGIDAICAIFGIVKAGYAYLPIDTSYPLGLQQRMVRSAKLNILLTGSSTKATALATSVDHALILSKLYQQPTTNTVPLPSVSSNHLFHVLYTSGSTDEPKGVCGTHAQMHNRLDWFWQTFPLSSTDVCCQKTALHFVDASLEIFGSLLKGCPLLIAPDAYSSNPEKLIKLLSDYAVTRISFVVSQLRALLIAAPDFGQRTPNLKLCIVSGERLTSNLVDIFQDALPETRLINLYGCSEMPEVSHFEVSEKTTLNGKDVPIGYPVTGTELHIVDENLKEVAQGTVGELLVGSGLQALGYLNRPEETDARFIDNPFNSTQRLYRTGDRVRINTDGILSFEGRTDDQVKVRGHRIEISAVEAALKSCSENLDTVKVVVQEDPVLAENRSLVAFVTPASIDTDKVLAMLRQQAPRHMQVQRVIALDTLPSTPSGKIDRRKLSELAQHSAAFKQKGSDSTLELVIQLWKSVLLTDTARVDENFFEIGGDSLRLAQLHQKLSDTFSAFDLSLTELLEYPTVVAQVNCLQRTTSYSSRSKSLPKNETKKQEDIAVVSVACRFPGASTPEEFWSNLRDGIDSVSDFSDDELEQPDTQLRNDPSYVKAGAILENIKDFDAEFFSLSEKEAALLDPQQRLLLECSWEAMERAGIVADKHNNRIGVYAGSSASSYFLNNVSSSKPVTEATLTEYQENLANDRNFLATRIAYHLQLTSPAINVQTACSTGLVVIHMACQSLRNDECDMVLAGSAALKIPHKSGYLFEEGMIRSSDGRFRAFDA